MNVAVPPKKSNTALTVVLTALLTLLAAGAIIGGIYYTRNRKTEVVQNTNSKPAVNTAAPNVSKTNKTANINSNINAADANAADANSATTATPTPSATPATKPALNPKERKNAESDIKNVIDDWKDSTENFDLDANLSNYADSVDYYRAGTVSSGAVRADKQNAFGAYSNIGIDISNMRITLGETGENAAVLFDKEWNFEGEGKSSSGKVQQQLQLTKIDGRWRITGERDLKVYYSR
jgi:ketosteroid isomerase-like protein